MVILKKITAATLVETLVASVIIMIVFMIASLSLNNVFKGMVKSNDLQYQNRVRELTYLTKNNAVSLPFYEDTEQWDIEIIDKEGDFYIMAQHKPSGSQKQVKIEKP